MKNSYIILAVLMFFLTVSCNSDDDNGTNCTPSTEVNGTNTYWAEYLGHDQTVDFWPDKFVNYWVIVVNKNDFPNIGFKIQGQYPDARYFSYNVYGANRNSTASLYDVEIKPEICSTNPFNNESSETPGNSKLYTLFVVPDSVSEFDTKDNVLKFVEGENEITLILRYYVPEDGDFANVELPVVEAFDLDTNEPVTIPPTSDFLTTTPTILAQINAAYNFQIDNIVRFYSGNATGLYPNNDNQYVRTFLNYDNDDVYVIRWKALTFPTSIEEYESSEVRYFSMNLGDNLTNNFEGVYDSQFTIDGDGFVTVVITDDTSDLRSKAEEAGYYFMPWTLPGDKGYLIYRNLLTKNADTAPYSIRNVPLPSFATNPSHIITHDAKNYIGDYAPYGQRMTKAEYLDNFGGFNN